MVGCLYHVRFVSLFAALATIHVAHAIVFDVINKAEDTKGGKLFDEKMGIEGAKKLLTLAPSNNVWKLTLGQDFENMKHVNKITLVIVHDELELVSSYHQTDKVKGFYEIRVSELHLKLCSHFLDKEINMLIYYEMTHILQWTANNDVSAKALTNGIAAFVVLRADLKPKRWVKYGQGMQWNERRDITAQFLVYCDRKFPGFVGRLNEKMETSYSPRYFVELTQKTIDKLWLDYKTESETNQSNAANNRSPALTVLVLVAIPVAVLLGTDLI